MDEIAFLSPAQLAKRWQVSKRTLARMRDKGEGPMPVKIAGGTFGHLRYSMVDVVAYENQQKMEAPHEYTQGEDCEPYANTSGKAG